ncbi:MAG: hypothetical protein QOF24_188 [Verrucomicrobiota bacterium]|jgi:hypothetical protein
MSLSVDPLMERSLLEHRLKRAALTGELTLGAKRLIIFLTPGFEKRAGGVLDISSMKRETRALYQLHRARVALCAVPGDDPDFFKYTWFENSDYLLDLETVLKSCERLDYLQLHIPDYAVNRLLDWLGAFERTLLRNIREIHLNVLLFNIDNIQGQNVKGLLSFGKATCATAHEAYTNLATREAQGVPLHRLGCLWGPEFFARSSYQEKEPLLIVSHDEHPLKGEVLHKIARAFPELTIQIIEDLHYDDYRKLIRRAKWGLTFGEGLDSYFGDPILSGGVAFAVFNDRYFTPEYAKLENVYPSWEALMDNLITDLHRLDEPVAYNHCCQQAYDLMAAYSGGDRFRENLRLFYLGEYTFP